MFGWRDSRFDDVWDEVARMNRLFARLDPGLAHGGVFPPVNVYDDGESFVVRAEIPGVEAKDIDVSATRDSLTIKGERKPAPQGDEVGCHRRERDHGVFSRSISLPTPVDPDKIRASHVNGVLEVVLPKAEESRPRKVKIEG
jgi:HSP20 family protein